MKAAVAAFVVVAAALPAGQEKPGLPAAAVTALDQLIAAEQAKARVPGVSVAIAWKNELVYSRAFGFADLESQSAATPRTAFRTASVAKPLTATGVMRLVEDGKTIRKGVHSVAFLNWR